MANRPIVSVFGANDPVAGSEDYKLARDVGRLLAERGYAVANGGYGGTMTASARGAKEGGGETIGITCSVWSVRANEFIDRVEVTDTLEDRLHRLVQIADGGYVVLPGATGTLLELAMVWELLAKGFLSPRPLVCVGAFWGPLVEMMLARKPTLGKWIAHAGDAATAAGNFPSTS